MGPLRERAAHVLAEAIRFRTVNPPGDERPLAAYFAALLRGAGVEAEVIDTPAGESREGRAAAWGRLRGRGSRPPIVLLSHLDVVPADAAEWSVDPFAGVRRGGFVIGRGALDAKGVSVVHLFALTELARRGIRLDRDVIFLATPDEEMGGRQGAGYLASHRPDLLGGAAYLLTEGGVVVLGTADAPAIWGVSVTEKAPCWIRVVASGESGHSSVPPEQSAVERLLAALEKVRRLEQPLRVTPEVAAMFGALGPLAPPEDAAGLRDLERALAADADFRQRFLARPVQRAMVQNTLAVTVLRGSSRTNVLPAEAEAHIDARLLPGERCEALLARVRGAIGDPGIALETLLFLPSRTSPAETALFRAIRRVAVATDPGALAVPRVAAGFTDAHYFRALGMTAYGFTPRWHYEGEHRGVHAANERVSLENLELGVETMIAILKALDREER